MEEEEEEEEDKRRFLGLKKYVGAEVRMFVEEEEKEEEEEDTGCGDGRYAAYPYEVGTCLETVEEEVEEATAGLLSSTGLSI